MSQHKDNLSSFLWRATDGLITGQRVLWGYCAVAGTFSYYLSASLYSNIPAKIFKIFFDMGIMGHWAMWAAILFAPHVLWRRSGSDEVHAAITDAELTLEKMGASNVDRKLFYKALLRRQMEVVESRPSIKRGS